LGKEIDIKEIKDRIVINVDYELANVACIDTEEGQILIDTPTLPQDISHWKQFLKNLGPRDVKYILITHHHFDHIMGCNQLGGKVIMHEKARSEMLQKDGTMRNVMARTLPGWTTDEVNFVLSEPIVLPEITFSNRMSIFLGDVTLRLFHLGGHTEGSICVYVEEDKVLFTGDNVSASQHPFRGHGNSAQWIKALKWMQDLEIDVIIPGHGEACQKDELDRLMEYLVRLTTITEDLMKKGVEREGVLKQVNQMMMDYYEIEPDLLEVTSRLFDLGTSRLYDEILSHH